MPTSKLGGWLGNLLQKAKPKERDYLDGIVDGDPNAAPVRRRFDNTKKKRTIPINIIIEIARGKGTNLITCNVTMNEFARFCNRAQSIMEETPDAVVFIHPAPIDDVEQDRVGVPLDRLVRIERLNGEILFELTKFAEPMDEHEPGATDEFL